MKIYLDVSCLNRPFDNQEQERVRLEARAVTSILKQCSVGRWVHVSSTMTVREIEANPDLEKQREIRNLLPETSRIIEIDEAIFDRANVLRASGFKAADAAHVAAAEALGADVFLTCDDRLLRLAQRKHVNVRVDNPSIWLMEQKDV